MDNVSESPVPTERTQQVIEIIKRARELLKQDGKKIKSEENEQEIVSAKYKLNVPRVKYSMFVSHWVPTYGGNATLDIQSSPSEGTTTLTIRFGQKRGANALIFRQGKEPGFTSESFLSQGIGEKPASDPDIHDFFWILSQNIPLYPVES